MTDRPFAFTLPLPSGVPTKYDSHLIRTLSSMRGQYLDAGAFERQLALGDSAVYEVYELKGLEVAGELFMGVSVIHPGKIGDEFYMTKGHYHTVRDTGELYHCLKGEGFMVMETSQGETAVEPLCPGKVLYVAPSWAHRSVCTSRQEDLVLFFAYPGNAGHDYGTIEEHGFRKVILEGSDGLQVVDNPRWRAQ